MLDLTKIDSTWTLFLDRDGVINNEKLNEYVLHWRGFVFSEGVLKALGKLSRRFGKLIVVTNQKGVGKGLMSQADLDEIHREMLSEIAAAYGRIDHVFFCTDLDDLSPNRKPQHGMALQAKEMFPDIDFSKSIMVGNKPGDMRFGRAAGMHTVFVATTNPDEPFPHPDVDLRFTNLPAFADTL